MKIKNSNQSGFSTVEFILVIVIVALIAVVGWLVYKNHHKTMPSVVTTSTSKSNTPSVAKTTTVTTNPYAGWKSYCSTEGGLCLKYPTSWTFANVSNINSNPEEYTITSPDNKVDVIYEPNDQLPLVNGDPTTFDILSVTPLASASGYEIVKGYSTDTKSPSNGVADGYFITSNSAAQQYNLSVGTHSADGDSLSWGGYFENAKSPNPSNEQVIYLGVPPNPYIGTFTSTVAAVAWFSSTDVQTASQILASLTYTQ